MEKQEDATKEITIVVSEDFYKRTLAAKKDVEDNLNIELEIGEYLETAFDDLCKVIDYQTYLMSQQNMTIQQLQTALNTEVSMPQQEDTEDIDRSYC